MECSCDFLGPFPMDLPAVGALVALLSEPLHLLAFVGRPDFATIYQLFCLARDSLVRQRDSEQVFSSSVEWHDRGWGFFREFACEEYKVGAGLVY